MCHSRHIVRAPCVTCSLPECRHTTEPLWQVSPLRPDVSARSLVTSDPGGGRGEPVSDGEYSPRLSISCMQQTVLELRVMMWPIRGQDGSAWPIRGREICMKLTSRRRRDTRLTLGSRARKGSKLASNELFMLSSNQPALLVVYILNTLKYRVHLLRISDGYLK